MEHYHQGIKSDKNLVLDEKGEQWGQPAQLCGRGEGEPLQAEERVEHQHGLEEGGAHEGGAVQVQVQVRQLVAVRQEEVQDIWHKRSVRNSVQDPEPQYPYVFAFWASWIRILTSTSKKLIKTLISAVQ